MSRSRRRRAASPRRRRRLPPLALVGALAVAVALLAWFVFARQTSPGRIELPLGLSEPPQPQLADMEPQVVAALTQARDAVMANPASAAAWGGYGIACDAHDLYAAAAECYRAARRLDPDSFQWPYFLARVREILGQDEADVLALHQEALRHRPNYAPAQVRYGDALLRAGRPAEAGAAYERALALDPQLAKAYRGRGQAQLLSGEGGAAVASLRRSLELQPDDGAAWSFLAQALVRTGDRAGARDAQTRARELEPIHLVDDPVLSQIGRAGRSADQCLRRADLKMRAGDFQGAIPDLEIALQARPTDGAAGARLAACYSRVGRSEDARAAYQRLLRDHPESAEARRDFAEVLVSSGRFDEAVEQLREAERLAGPDASSVAQLGAALAQSGQVPEALREFERAAQLGDLLSRDHNNWGTALAQSGRLEEAIVAFAEAVRLDDTSASAHYHLALALEGVGQRERAREHLTRSAALDPAGRAAQQLRAATP